MNNKVKIIVATLAVGMAATLTGCGGCFGCAGCGSSSSSKTLTRSNWFTGTSYNGIQPSFIEGNENFSKEKITYDVTYDKTDADNDYVSLDYKDGEFTTEFYATKWNWTGTEDIVIPEGYADEKVSSEIVYYYRTELKIKVQYTMKTGSKASSDWFEDHVVTECYFRAAGKSLQPVYSRQEIKSTSPANYQPDNLKDAYKEIEVTYENIYNYSCSRVLSKTYEDGKFSEESTKLKSTVFDNSSVYIVARSLLKTSSSPSESVYLYSPAAGGTDKYAITGSDKSLTAQERADYTKILSDEKFGLYKAASENDEGVKTTAVSISYNGGNLHGTSQTVWYASITDSDYNVSRATMLKLAVPISFNLGTLNYTLKEIESTLWNG